MFIPHTYSAALILMLISMLCWGSWANTQKIDKRWRFELFYWDYIWGLLACALLFGLTLGSTNPASPDSFFRNLSDCKFPQSLGGFLRGCHLQPRKPAPRGRDIRGGHGRGVPDRSRSGVSDRSHHQLHHFAERESPFFFLAELR